MKKYRLKRWLELLLITIEVAIFISLFAVIEKNMLLFVIDKILEAVVFIAIGDILVKYGSIADEE